MVWEIAAVVIALLVGAIGGFILRRRSSMWCPTCGAGLRCIPCTVRAQNAEQQPAADCR